MVSLYSSLSYALAQCYVSANKNLAINSILGAAFGGEFLFLKEVVVNLSSYPSSGRPTLHGAVRR